MEAQKAFGYGFNFSLMVHNFFAMLKRLIWPVLLVALVLGISTYQTAQSTYAPTYSSSVVFSVKANFSSTTDLENNSSYLDSNASLVLSNTFPHIITSESATFLLCSELGTDTVPATLSAYSTAESALFTMIATGADPQKVYDVLMAAIKIYPQAAASVLGDTRIEILNKPIGPSTEPVNSNTAVISAMTTVLTITGIGVFLIFLLSLTRKTLHSAEDLRKLVNLKCLAYIPAVKLKKRSNQANSSIAITNSRIEPAFNESIRALRVKVKRLMDKSDACVLLVTSTIPNEGKTTVATNLALSLASEGRRVILIDGDLRKQSLKSALNVEQDSEGLVEILSGESKNFRLTTVPNSTLLLLSGDKTDEQPQALLDSPRMEQVLQLLREKLDYIIIDSPPAGIMSDAVTIAKYVDATLYVVRQDTASTTEILDSVQSLAAAGANLIGCVLNRTQVGTTRYGYGSKYTNGYSYSYGNKYSSYSYGYASKYSRYSDVNKTEDESAGADD